MTLKEFNKLFKIEEQALISVYNWYNGSNRPYDYFDGLCGIAIDYNWRKAIQDVYNPTRHKMCYYFSRLIKDDNTERILAFYFLKEYILSEKLYKNWSK